MAPLVVLLCRCIGQVRVPGSCAGAITTLGRGGSDLSATFLGAALGVCEVVVWKDVNGVLSADPRIVRDARVINELTFDEATELAYFGAQVCQHEFMRVSPSGAAPRHSSLVLGEAGIACMTVDYALTHSELVSMN